MGGMMNGYFGPYAGSFWPIGPLINLVIIIGVVLLVVWVVQKVRHSSNQNTPSNNSFSTGQILSAREILDIRYARGELTHEAYQTMLNDIS